MHRYFFEYHCEFLGPICESMCLCEAHFVIWYAHVWLCVYFRHVWCMCTKGKCVYLRYFWPNKKHSHKYTHATFQHSIDNYCTIHYNTVQCCIVMYSTLLSIAVCDFEHSRSSVECWYLSFSDTQLHSLWLCVTKFATLSKILCDTHLHIVWYTHFFIRMWFLGGGSKFLKNPYFSLKKLLKPYLIHSSKAS